MTSSIAQLKDNFTREGILLCFNGSFSHEIIEELGSALKTHLVREQITHIALADLFAVFIEQMQNVRNYSVRMPLHNADSSVMQTAIVVIGKQQMKYWVHSGNYVALQDTEPLLERIQLLNGMDKEEIRRLYKTQLRSEVPPTATGAGLGLIDMARRMSEPFDYSIEPVDANYGFFSLRVTI